MGTSAGTVAVDFEGNFGQINSQLSAFVASGVGKFLHLEELSKSSFVRVGVAAGAIGFGLFKIGEAFDSAYDTIRAGTGATGRDLEKLQGDFKSVVRDVPADFGSASKAIEEINSRLGLTGQPLQHLSKQFLELSRITGTDLEGNIENATKAFGAFEVPVEQMPAKLDSLFRASQASGIGIDRLAENARTLSAPLRALGFDFETSISLMAQAEKTGVNTTTMMAGLRMGVRNLAKDGENVPETFRRILDEIQRLGPGAESLNLAFELFGTRAGTDLADAIAVGAFSLDEMYAIVSGGSDTIIKAGKDTQDFGEKWQMVKNRAMLAFEPIALRTFDIVGKLAEAFLSIPDWGQQFIIGGAAVSLALSPLLRFGSGITSFATEAVPKFVGAMGEGGFKGAAARGGIALGALALGVGVVKPKLDELGVSAEASGAMVGAMTGIAFGPWGGVVGGVLGAVAGGFGLLADDAESAREKVAALGQEIEGLGPKAAAQTFLSSLDIFGGDLAGKMDGLIARFRDLAGVNPAAATKVLDALRAMRDESGKPLLSDTVIAGLEAGLARGEAAYARYEARQLASSETNRRLVATNGDLAAITDLTAQAFTTGEASLSRFASSGVIADLRLKDLKKSHGDAVVGAYALSDAVRQQTGSTERSNQVLTEHKTKLYEQLVAAGASEGQALTLTAALFDLGQQKPKPEVDLATQQFDAKKIGADMKMAQLHGSRADPIADMNKTPFNQKHGATFGELIGMSGWVGAPRVDAETSGWVSAKGRVRADLEGISRSSASPGIGGRGGSLSIGFFEHGGEVPGRRGDAVPIMAHAGEGILSAELMDRIKRGAPNSDVRHPFASARPAGGGGETVINLHFHGDVNGVGDFQRRVIEALQRARRNGISI